MSDPLHWPALTGFTPAPPIRCRRGIWGKVHGEASDYRWIARSDGFGVGCPELAGALRIGNESVPVTGVLWRRLPDRWLACSVYPSRARDAAGRPTVIEKQVAEWRPPATVPAIVGALTLLPAIARFDDRDWWDRCARGYRQGPDDTLALADPDCPLVEIASVTLAARIEEARGGLVAALDGDALRRFYRRLLGGRFPAGLQGSGDGEALPPGALAALLLPLPRLWADRLSLAGVVAARQADPQDLIRNWDGYVSATAADEDGEVDAEVADLADTMVRALLDADPQLLQGTKSTIRARPAPSGKASGPTWWDDDLSQGASPDARRRIPCVPALLDGLCEPAPDAAAVIRLLRDFARDPGARRLDLTVLGAAMQGASGPEKIDSQSAAALCAWPGEVEASDIRMDPEEKRLKADQLRAAAALLLPDPRRAQSPGLPREPTIPGLLPALALTPGQAGPQLLRLGESTGMALLEQSLACPHPILRKKIIDWVDAWCNSPQAPPWPGVADMVCAARGVG